MKQEITEAARRWWLDIDLIDQITIYGKGNSLFNPSVDEIVSIWIQEVVKPYWYNKDNKQWFENDEAMCLSYLKEQENKEPSNVSVSDDWDKFEKDCDKLEEQLWNEPTGTPPVSESVEEAAKDVNLIAEEYIRNDKDYQAEGFSEYQNGKFNGFCDGYTKAKSEDKELIRELLEHVKFLKGRYVGADYPLYIEVEVAITKANNYLNK